ncbi:DUF1284 domain-containing protein [Xylanibacillus composti]|uniref:DUF1284 domain-containing protein n=1 Tax=Xylanibacillus composti TaxID=1572762 RepID=A0A8J4M0V8_9BACL|nr:DUF1284 domain-containing protein [Xylanibacillus composti]MDT9726810.1 DUF1284 domain-containing protein [Xylanibacillus composti]GIQ67207.1 DUF1284 domain-containing protein [Xylanibacillus composti]
MSVRLRGHHLLCLLGFRGMGYSEEFARNMSGVYEKLRQSPETVIRIVEGADDLCAKFPCDQEYHCDHTTVLQHDERIARHLDVKPGDSVTWDELVERIRVRVQPRHIPEWCATCQWLSYGVCEEGMARIQKGEPLPPLNSL